MGTPGLGQVEQGAVSLLGLADERSPAPGLLFLMFVPGLFGLIFEPGLFGLVPALLLHILLYFLNKRLS